MSYFETWVFVMEEVEMNNDDVNNNEIRLHKNQISGNYALV